MKTAPYLYALFTLTLQLGCSGSESADFESMLDDLLEGTVPQITTGALPDRLDGPAGLILLDTRSREEFDVSHISSAQWAGFDGFDIAEFDGVDRETPVVVYCSVGKRSEMIGEKLKGAGFLNVLNLRGGIFKWANEGRPLVDKGGPTKFVHPYSSKWGRWLGPEVPKKQ